MAANLHVVIGHLHDGVIYYYDQDPSGFCFLVQIRAFAAKFKYKRKNEKNSGRSSEMTPSSIMLSLDMQYMNLLAFTCT